jgi:uroporphyrin-III C-methyltransferase
MSSEAPPAETHATQEESKEVKKAFRHGLWKILPRRLNSIWVLAAFFAPLIAWQWYDTHNQIADVKHELAKRLADADAWGKESHTLAKEAVEAGRRTEAKLGLLEARMAESQSQQLALEELYQELTRNRDEATLEEVEQLLLIANQQVQLASNVKAALIAMQEADARLQRIGRPQLIPLRKILAADMDLLRAAPYTDTVGISLRLDNLAASVEKLPLAMELRPPEAPASNDPSPPGESPWRRFLRETWADIKQLIRIQSMDKPDVALLAPSQAYFLRENLKLRLLSARHALLARDGTSFNTDIDTASDWIKRYYDTESAPVMRVLEMLRELRGNEVGVELPRISASLDAVRNYRLGRDRGSR